MKPLIAEDTLKDRLQAIIAKKPQTIALVGERGRGKSYVAEYIAEVLLGSKPSLVNNPHYIVVDAAKSGIDEVREVHKMLTLQVPGKPAIRRVVVIEHIDNFGHEAQNALLKTLEEPPEATMIIITVDATSNVLPTILSRVQQTIIPALALDTLQHELDIDEAVVTRAYLMSDGSAGTFFGLVENQQEHNVVQAIEAAKIVLQKPRYARLAQIDSFTKKSTISPELLLDGIIRVLQASFRQIASSPNSSPEQIGTAQKRLAHTIAALSDLQNGVSAKLVLTRLFINL